MYDEAGQDLAATSIRMVMGAGESIALSAYYVDGREFGVDLEGLAYSIDSRIPSRCLLPLPGIFRGRDGTISRREERIGSRLDELKGSIKTLQDAGWQVRLVPDVPSESALIVDGYEVLYYSYLNDRPGPYYSSEPRQVAHYLRNYEHSWEYSFDVSASEALYDRAEAFETTEATSRVAFASHEAWGRIIYELAKSPNLLHGLEPRKFEELIAELLTREGMDVSLTPSTRDGGRDILAFQSTPIGRHLYLVECKRHQLERPVGVSVVRQLYGVVAHERATAGLVVATSRFSREALAFVETVRHQMGLKDYENVKEWLRSKV